MKETIKIVLTPPEPWHPSRDAFTPGNGPDPFAIYRVLESEGVFVELFDPHRRPWNPLYGFHPIYMGLDIARTVRVLTGHRDADLVVSIFEASALFLLFLRRLFGFRVPVAMWDFIPTPEWPPRALMQNLTIPKVDHLFLLSTQQREYLEKNWKASNKTSIIYQHIDAHFFRPIEPVAPKSILSIGDDAGRDFATLLNAVHDIDVDLTIKTRRQLDLQPGARARVNQVSQRLPFADLRQLYADAEIVVLPINVTHNVSGVGSLLEAMAMGKPIVVSDNPPLRDYFVPDETALVVPPNDPRALRDAIISLRQDPAKQKALGAAARAMLERQFANEPFARNFAGKIRAFLNEFEACRAGH